MYTIIWTGQNGETCCARFENQSRAQSMLANIERKGIPIEEVLMFKDDEGIVDPQEHVPEEHRLILSKQIEVSAWGTSLAEARKSAQSLDAQGEYESLWDDADSKVESKDFPGAFSSWDGTESLDGNLGTYRFHPTQEALLIRDPGGETAFSLPLNFPMDYDLIKGMIDSYESAFHRGYRKGYTDSSQDRAGKVAKPDCPWLEWHTGDPPLNLRILILTVADEIVEVVGENCFDRILFVGFDNTCFSRERIVAWAYRPQTDSLMEAKDDQQAVE